MHMTYAVELLPRVVKVVKMSTVVTQSLALAVFLGLAKICMNQIRTT